MTKFLLKLLESKFFVFPQCVCSLHDILMHSISWHWNCIMGFELLLLNVISNFVQRTTAHLSKIDAGCIKSTKMAKLHNFQTRFIPWKSIKNIHRRFAKKDIRHNKVTAPFQMCIKNSSEKVWCDDDYNFKTTLAKHVFQL